MPDNQSEQLFWEATASPSQKDVELIDGALDSFNNATAPLNAVQALACFARLPDGRLIGGAMARTWGQCCELQQIWVDEQSRQKGIGRRLVQLVEKEARNRGCSLLYVETFSFQSPEFYRRLGFEPACEFRGFPNGIVKHAMRKLLA